MPAIHEDMARSECVYINGEDVMIDGGRRCTGRRAGTRWIIPRATPAIGTRRWKNIPTGRDMSTSPKGYLLVAMEPPALEEKFNDWYDTDHVPERLRLAGFESARRFVCVCGWPRYLAFYDLISVRVIDSPGYRAIANGNFSPWTKRFLTRVRGFYRSFGVQVYSDVAARESRAGARRCAGCGYCAVLRPRAII